jgi:hypothetical protein
MENARDRMAETVPDTLEQEMQLIREAIAMVASGVSPRVVVASIRFGEALLDPARRLALEAGVRLVPLWRAEEAGADIAVERIRE